MFGKSVLNLVSQIVGLAVSFGDRFLLVGLLVRSWGPETYSDWVTLVAAAGLFSLAEFGYQIQYGNRLSQAHARGDTDGYTRALGFGLFVYSAVAVALAVVLVIVVIGVDLAHRLGLRHLDGAGAMLVFMGLAASSTLHVARAGLSQIYRSQGDYHRGILADSTLTAMTIGLAILAAVCGAGPRLLALVYLVSETVLGWGGMGWDITRRYPGLRLWPQWPSRVELSNLRRSIGWYAMIAGLPTIWLHAPVLVMGGLGLGGASLVSFVVQRSLVNFGRTFSTMLSVAAGIELATLVHTGERDQLRRGVFGLARLNAAFAGALLAGLFCFGPSVVAVWTGKPALASTMVLMGFAAPALVTAGSAPLLMLCMYADRPRAAGIALGVQIAVGVPLALFAGRWMGVAGVVLGIAFGEMVGSGLILPLLAARLFQIEYARLTLQSWAASAVVGAWGAATGWLIIHTVGMDAMWRLLLGLSLWGGIGVAPAIIFALPRTIRARLGAAAQGYLGGRYRP